MSHFQKYVKLSLLVAVRRTNLSIHEYHKKFLRKQQLFLNINIFSFEKFQFRKWLRSDENSRSNWVFQLHLKRNKWLANKSCSEYPIGRETREPFGRSNLKEPSTNDLTKSPRILSPLPSLFHFRNFPLKIVSKYLCM